MSIHGISKTVGLSGHFVETDFVSTFERNPQHAVFWFARYKFVAKMFAGMKRVIEVGCGNGFAGAIVRQSVGELVQTDQGQWDPLDPQWDQMSYGKFDSAFALDVIEHIPQDLENIFISNIGRSITQYGSLIIGTPSLESQPYASPLAKQEHVNCFTEERLRELMKRHFHCVYMFGMNDEVVHTGFAQMCHYRFALSNTPR